MDHRDWRLAQCKPIRLPLFILKQSFLAFILNLWAFDDSKVRDLSRINFRSFQSLPNLG